MLNIKHNTFDDLPNHWRRLAWVTWPKAEWIKGEGRYAYPCPCKPGLTITLWEDRASAENAWTHRYCCEEQPQTGEIEADGSNDCVMFSAAELERMKLPEPERIKHEVIDLQQVLEAQPELLGTAAAVERFEDEVAQARSDAWFQRYGQVCDRARSMKFRDAVDLLTADYEAPTFLVDHLIPDQGITLLTGDVGSGKTAFALHLACALATGSDVAGEFSSHNELQRPVLYLNGEMSTNDVRRYLQQTLSGLGVSLARGRLRFHGYDALAPFGFGIRPDWRSDALGAVLELDRPSLVILDSLRALADMDENSAEEVRKFFSWLRALAVKYDCSFLVVHHLRKMSVVSNSSRERVSGSRDLLACCDVHVAVTSRSGAPMHQLEIEKTRVPAAGIGQGAKWAIETKLVVESGSAAPPKSIFIARAASEGGAVRLDAVAEAKVTLSQSLQSDGPQTRYELKADSGSRKRAFDWLLRAGDVSEVGKKGRAKLYDCKPAVNSAA